MTPLTVEGKPLDVAARLAELTGFVTDAACDGLPAHELERGLWQYLLRLGHDVQAEYTWLWHKFRFFVGQNLITVSPFSLLVDEQPMIQLEFTEAEKQSLHYERYHHPHSRVQRKMEALWLKSQGVAHREISRLTGISSTTLASYLRAYQAGGIETLKTVRFYRPQSDLWGHQGTLEAHFRQHPPASAKPGDGDHLQIELLYLPAYSPNLNLIERLWKFVKKTCLYSTYYAHFHDFKQAISDCLAQTHIRYSPLSRPNSYEIKIEAG